MRSDVKLLRYSRVDTSQADMLACLSGDARGVRLPCRPDKQKPKNKPTEKVVSSLVKGNPSVEIKKNAVYPAGLDVSQ